MYVAENEIDGVSFLELTETYQKPGVQTWSCEEDMPPTDICICCILMHAASSATIDHLNYATGIGIRPRAVVTMYITHPVFNDIYFRR